MAEEKGVAPHRGFSNKAREVLIGDDDVHLHAVPVKSSSDFDIRRKLKACTIKIRRNSQNTNDTTPNTPKSPQSSSCSMDRDHPPQFDSIGEAPIVKHHKKLGQIGKTRSCVEFKNVDKRLIRTYQEDNIVKMPSIGSDMDSIIATRSDIGSIDSIAKAAIYTVSDEQKKKDVKKWLMEKTD